MKRLRAKLSGKYAVIFTGAGFAVSTALLLLYIFTPLLGPNIHEKTITAKASGGSGPYGRLTFVQVYPYEPVLIALVLISAIFLWLSIYLSIRKG